MVINFRFWLILRGSLPLKTAMNLALEAVWFLNNQQIKKLNFNNLDDIRDTIGNIPAYLKSKKKNNGLLDFNW